jgi:hypothetical protein
MKRKSLLIVSAITASIILFSDSSLISGTSDQLESETAVPVPLSHKRDAESRPLEEISRGGDFFKASREDSERPNFSGRWRLNLHDSDNADQIVRKAITRNRDVESSLFLRVRQVFGKRHNDMDTQLGRLLVKVLEPPKTMLIQHEDSGLTILDAKGRLQSLSVDKNKDIETVEGTAIATKWWGMKLVTEEVVRDQGMARLTLALAPGGFQLVLTQEIQHVKLAHSIVVRSVYDFISDS